MANERVREALARVGSPRGLRWRLERAAHLMSAVATVAKDDAYVLDRATEARRDIEAALAILDGPLAEAWERSVDCGIRRALDWGANRIEQQAAFDWAKAGALRALEEPNEHKEADNG